MANCIAGLFPSMAWRGRPGTGRSRPATVKAGMEPLLAGDAEPLLRPVGGRLLLPGRQARAQRALARVGLAHRVRVDAVRVDLEGQVAPAGEHLRRRLRQDLVDRLPAEVGL